MTKSLHFLEDYPSSLTETGQNTATTAVSTHDLHDFYTDPFETAIRLAGLGGVMASYSEFAGTPIHISYDVLTKLLRGCLGLPEL